MKIDRTTLRDRCRMAMAGIDKHFASDPSIPVNGSDKTPADVKGALQSNITAADTTQATRATWLAASHAEQALHDSTVSLLATLRSYVVLKLGTEAATLADFGFSPRTRQVPTVETKAAAAAKSLATRAVRHTMGSRQKAKITGTVTPPAGPEPVTAPAPTGPAVPGVAPPGTAVPSK